MVRKLGAARVVARDAGVSARASSSDRRIVDGIDGRSDIGGIPDAGERNAFGPQFQDFEKEGGLVAVDADDGRDVTSFSRPDHVGKGLPVRGRMLEVDDDVIHTGGSEQFDDLGRGEGHIGADLGLAGL